MFKSLSMNVKQAGSYIIIVLFLIVITNTSYNNVLHLRDQTLHIGQNNMPMIVSTGNLKEEFTLLGSQTAKHAFVQSEAEKAKMESTIKEESTNISKHIEELKELN